MSKYKIAGIIYIQKDRERCLHSVCFIFVVVFCHEHRCGAFVRTTASVHSSCTVPLPHTRSYFFPQAFLLSFSSPYILSHVTAFRHSFRCTVSVRAVCLFARVHTARTCAAWSIPQERSLISGWAGTTTVVIGLAIKTCLPDKMHYSAAENNRKPCCLWLCRNR